MERNEQYPGAPKSAVERRAYFIRRNAGIARTPVPSWDAAMAQSRAQLGGPDRLARLEATRKLLG